MEETDSIGPKVNAFISSWLLSDGNKVPQCDDTGSNPRLAAIDVVVFCISLEKLFVSSGYRSHFYMRIILVIEL